jgi:hypothetical protein
MLGGGHGDSGRFSLVRLRPTALVRCYDCAFDGGVLGVALWASLVSALGSIALCFIVFLGELLCVPTVRHPLIQGEGEGVLSGGEVDKVLSLLLVGVDDDSFPAASLLTTLPSGLSRRRSSSCVFCVFLACLCFLL